MKAERIRWRRQWVWSVAATACATLLACRPAAVLKPVGDDTLRVMTYNIAAGHGDIEKIVAEISAADAQLVALQEVDVHWDARSGFADQARLLADRLRMDMRFAPIYRIADPEPGKPPREYGVALLSRFPIGAWRNEAITRLSTQAATPVPTLMPGFLSATVETPSGPIRVFNTHTDYRPDPSVRTKQVAEMMAIIGDLQTPTLLFGDLNAPPTAPEMQPLLGFFHDAWPAEAGDGLTYPATAPVKRIDYVLTSSHFRLLSARVPVTTASDHRPVVVELARVTPRR